MIKTILKFSFLSFGIFSYLHSYSQCNNTTAVENVTNGNFEAGNVGFTIGTPGEYHYLDSCKYSNPGSYQVSDNNCNGTGKSSFNSPAMDGVFDHTSGQGKMLLIDAAAVNDISWETTVTAQPNQTYYFSAWATELDDQNAANNAILQFQIVLPDGTAVNLGNTFQTTYKTWTQFYITWLSADTAEQVTLRIMDTQTNISIGNDFALDDISFINTCTLTATNNAVDNIQEISFFPNPIQNELNYTWTNYPGNYTVQLLNSQGAVLATQNNTAAGGHMEMSGYNDGIYMLKFIADGKTITKKVVKY
jgi:hypothetical protein